MNCPYGKMTLSGRFCVSPNINGVLLTPFIFAEPTKPIKVLLCNTFMGFVGLD
jgi:hypothetical protein